MMQRRLRSSAAGTATGHTKGPPVLQTRNLCTAGNAEFQAIPTRLVGEGGDQREAHHNPVTPHARPQLLQPPAHLLNPNMRTRKRRNEKSEVRNKDDLAETTSATQTQTQTHKHKHK